MGLRVNILCRVTGVIIISKTAFLWSAAVEGLVEGLCRVPQLWSAAVECPDGVPWESDAIVDGCGWMPWWSALVECRYCGRLRLNALVECLGRVPPWSSTVECLGGVLINSYYWFVWTSHVAGSSWLIMYVWYLLHEDTAYRRHNLQTYGVRQGQATKEMVTWLVKCMFSWQQFSYTS